ncbi:MAG: serine hydrolase domain-containing protein, partial [Chitinophagaceae bacterium]
MRTNLIDGYIDQFMESHMIPGIGVGICVDGRVLYEKVKGTGNTGTDKKLTDRAMFPMASISKVFSATAAMQLVEEKLITLDDSILKHLPGLRPCDTGYGDVSLQQILSHTSGIPDLRDYDWLHPQYDDGAAIRYLEEVSTVPLFAVPGEEYQYSNRAYNIIASLVQYLTHTVFEQRVQEKIFSPLGMNDATFLYNDIDHERR